jgi:hypothetical protein
MAVPSTCGKLQSWHALGARAPRVRGVTARAPLAFMACCCAAGLAAQEEARVPRDLLVTSAVERVGAAAEDDPTTVQTASAASASQAGGLIVSVRFTNTTEQVLDSIRITSPVPPELRYVEQSASGPGSDVLFSVDAGVSFGLPDELTLATPDGGVRGADPADYTHVRWILRAPLDAGATGIARFRAVPR